MFSPDQVVAAIMDAEDIVLRGFGELDEMASAHIPNAPFACLGNHDLQEGVIKEFDRRVKLRQYIIFSVIGLMLFLSGLLLGFMSEKSLNAATDTGQANALAHWQVISVKADSVDVFVGDRLVVFPVGSTLPSGEILKTTNPSNQSYSTTNQFVSIRKSEP